jgi:hypothetical protein
MIPGQIAAADIPPKSVGAVAIFSFNRPDLTAELCERVLIANPARLYLYVDGPRKDRPNEQQLVAENIAVLRGVAWKCPVIEEFSVPNLGCRKRIQSGLDHLFEREDSAIILEDDCMPEPGFFEFCQSQLQLHRDNSAIGVISGYNPFEPTPGPISVLSSPVPFVWGWATWRSTWETYEHDVQSWRLASTRTMALSALPSKANRRFWRHAFDQVLNGFDTWDYQLVLTAFLGGWRTHFPSRSLISNQGFRPDATHTTSVLPDDIPANWPSSSVEMQGAVDDLLYKNLYRRAAIQSLVLRALPALRRINCITPLRARNRKSGSG